MNLKNGAHYQDEHIAKGIVKFLVACSQGPGFGLISDCHLSGWLLAVGLAFGLRFGRGQFIPDWTFSK